jgi:hypothetical protein
MAKFTGESIIDESQVQAKPAVIPALASALAQPQAAVAKPIAQTVVPSISLPPHDQRSFALSEANRRAAEKLQIAEEKRKETTKRADQASAPPGAAFMEKAQKLKDFEGYLNDYKDELSKNKKVLPANIPLMPVDANTATITSKYTALLMGIKDAYQLGALTGPDMSLVESQLTNPATISGIRTSRDAMKAQVDVLEGILKRSKENLESSYGKKMDLGAAKLVPEIKTGNKPPTGAPTDVKQAPDGKWYSPDPKRPGKYLMWGE